VLIIGAGAAGLQCAEFLSRRSPLKQAQQAGAGSGSGRDGVHHSLSVLVLEGRDRIGGRIHSVPMQHADEQVIVDHGAVSASCKEHAGKNGRAGPV